MKLLAKKKRQKTDNKTLKENKTKALFTAENKTYLKLITFNKKQKLNIKNQED